MMVSGCSTCSCSTQHPAHSHNTNLMPSSRYLLPHFHNSDRRSLVKFSHCSSGSCREIYVFTTPFMKREACHSTFLPARTSCNQIRFLVAPCTRAFRWASYNNWLLAPFKLAWGMLFPPLLMTSRGHFTSSKICNKRGDVRPRVMEGRRFPSRRLHRVVGVVVYGPYFRQTVVYYVRDKSVMGSLVSIVGIYLFSKLPVLNLYSLKSLRLGSY